MENSELQEAREEVARLQARLAELATTDALTGLKNHRAFQEALAVEVARSHRYSIPLSLILLDVDHFQVYNGDLGHTAGDEVLKLIAGILHAKGRNTDILGRYGGGEFAVILPSTHAGRALIAAERFRAALAEVAWPERAVTASFGAATLAPEDTTDSILQSAEAALRHAKAAGRDRVVHIRDVGGEGDPSLP